MNALLTPRLVRLAAECEQRARDLAEASRRRVALSSQRIEAQARLSRQLSPQSVLRRGFSITRDSHGRAIRSTRTVRPGERISTEVVDGQFPSVIEKRQ